MSPPTFTTPTLRPVFRKAPAMPVTIKVFPEPLPVAVIKTIFARLGFCPIFLCDLISVEMPTSLLISAFNLALASLMFSSSLIDMSKDFETL